MIDFERARRLFLGHYNPILRQSQPFGDVAFPGEETSHLKHVSDLVWIKHTLGDLDLTDAERDSWAARINRDQQVPFPWAELQHYQAPV